MYKYPLIKTYCKGLCGKVVKLTLVALLLASLPYLAGVVSAQSIPSSGSSTMLRSDDSRHKVIKEACSVCHKEEEFDFLIMIYSTRSKNKKAREEEESSPSYEAMKSMEFAPTAVGAENFHKQMNCFFCHFKDKNGNPVQDKFITVDGRLSSLCTICHVSYEDLHFISETLLDKNELMILLNSYGLKLDETGSINCITCHTIHSDEAFGFSVKDKFKQFIRNSIYFNPHGLKISCIACHEKRPEPKKQVTYIDNDYEKICRKCHENDIDGHHVTKVKSTINTYLMDFLNFPLLNEEIFCSTCHDEVCYDEINPRNKDFLFNGPYRSKAEFCDKCHKKEVSTRENAHSQIDAKGNIIKKKCAICHTKLQQEGDKEIYLVAPIKELCSRCHVVFNHPDLNHLIPIDGEKLDILRQYEDEFKIEFPLSDSDEITCTTCHNPHDKGVLKGVKAVGAGEYLLLRGVSFEEACTPCHGKIY